MCASNKLCITVLTLNCASPIFENESSTQYEALAEQIESILQGPEGAIAQISDERTRRRLVEGGRKLAASSEQPRDIAQN